MKRPRKGLLLLVPAVVFLIGAFTLALVYGPSHWGSLTAVLAVLVSAVIPAPFPRLPKTKTDRSDWMGSGDTSGPGSSGATQEDPLDN